LLARLDHPDKRWKFSADDVAERAHWDDYMAAYEEAITATSTSWAPWHVIPDDHKHAMQALVVQIIVDASESLDLEWPSVSDETRTKNGKARAALEAERDDD